MSDIDSKTTRIVALADSLALPRDEGTDVVRWEDTWPSQLQHMCDLHGVRAETINCGARSRRITTTIEGDFYEHIDLKRPDIVILQIGIVDCAPRLISLWERRVMNRRWFPASLREKIIRRRSASRASRTRRNPLAKVYTSPELFAATLSTFGKRLRQTHPRIQLFALPILGRLSQLEVHSPGYISNIKLYNDLLKSFCLQHAFHWFDPEDIVDSSANSEFFASDAYHLLPLGNRRIAERLFSELFEKPHLAADDERHGARSNRPLPS
jgi:hypothetical protein